MEIKWCHNSRTGEIFSYEVDGDWNSFPRGTFLAYGDYLTTGLESEAAAQAWAREWHSCLECRGSRRGAVGERCSFCRSVLVGPDIG